MQKMSTFPKHLTVLSKILIILDDIKYFGLRKIYYETSRFMAVIRYPFIPLKIINDIVYFPVSRRRICLSKLITKEKNIKSVSDILLNGNKKFYPGISDLDMMIILDKKVTHKEKKLIGALLTIDQSLIPHLPFFLPQDLLGSALENYIFLYTPPLTSILHKNHGNYNQTKRSRLQRLLCVIEYHVIRQIIIMNCLRYQMAKKIEARHLLKIINQTLSDLDNYSSYFQKEDRVKISSLITMSKRIRKNISRPMFVWDKKTSIGLSIMFHTCLELDDIFLASVAQKGIIRNLGKYPNDIPICLTLKSYWGHVIFLKNYMNFRYHPLIRLLKLIGLKVFDINLYIYLSYIVSDSTKTINVGNEKSQWLKPLIIRRNLFQNWLKSISTLGLNKYMPPPVSALCFRSDLIKKQDFHTKFLNLTIESVLKIWTIPSHKW